MSVECNGLIDLREVLSSAGKCAAIAADTPKEIALGIAFLDEADDGRANHHRIGKFPRCARVVDGRDAEAEGNREVREFTHLANQLGGGSYVGGAGPGDA